MLKLPIIMILNGKSYEIIEQDLYMANRAMYRNAARSALYAVQFVYNNVEYILPLRTGIIMASPGLYDLGSFDKFILPATEEEYQIYSRNNPNIVDYNNSSSIMDTIKKQNILKDLEKELLIANVDNIFTPTPDVNDMPEMVAMKNAVIAKRIDINKYADRFESFANDKRLFKNNNISTPMIRRICNALDIKATLTLEDANANVANPMGTTISVVLNNAADDGGEEV